MNLSMGLGPALRQESALRLEQDLDLTVKLNVHLESPVETARRIYDESRKVQVCVRLGDYKVVVRAASISKEDFESLFQDERFGAIIGSRGNNFQFINRDMRAPKCICEDMPTLIAFHCIAVIGVKSFDDESGTLRQYQAIALEMAYARTILPEESYRVYAEWRPTVERTDFFKRGDWQKIVARTSERFSTMVRDMYANAAGAKFIVMGSSSERFTLTPHGAVSGNGNTVACSRRITRRTVISLPPGKPGQ